MDLSGEVRANIADKHMAVETTVGAAPADASSADASSVDEARWVAYARQGDEAAWERLMRRYEAPVFRLAYLILADAAEAEDVAQEAFIRAYLALDRFDVARPFRPWLLSIAANLARNRRRSIGRYLAALRRLAQADPRIGVSAARVEEHSEAQVVWQAVQQLRPAVQEIIYLRYFLDLSEAETAQALNIAQGTVKSRLHRALQQLRVVMQE
jgi:RNA polymerase sigma-70 factor (ECF subfamily)